MLLGQSQKEIEYLLEKSGSKSTITLWGNDVMTEDQIHSLANLIQEIGPQKFYLDVNENLRLKIMDCLEKNDINLKFFTQCQNALQKSIF